LEIAEFNLNGDVLEAAAFYSQQGAEKALKAIYISEFSKLLRTHDLVKLAKEVKAPTKIIELAAEITPAYVATRYPDVEEIYDKESVTAVFNASKEVLEWAEKEASS
jgi:Uncharacterized conserved protein related to C-terminal domain of eukaryotic chaperone, SACSIN